MIIELNSYFKYCKLNYQKNTKQETEDATETL